MKGALDTVAWRLKHPPCITPHWLERVLVGWGDRLLDRRWGQG